MMASKKPQNLHELKNAAKKPQNLYELRSFVALYTDLRYNEDQSENIDHPSLEHWNNSRGPGPRQNY